MHVVEIPSPCPNDVYAEKMAAAMRDAAAAGVTRVVFGDLYLEDIRAYREEALAELRSIRCSRCGAGRPVHSRAR